MEAESASHRDTALRLYLDALKSPDLHPDGLALLDSAVILFALDVSTQIGLVPSQKDADFDRQRNRLLATGTTK
jgi:hypothetical protein